MSESIQFVSRTGSKVEAYQAIIPQIKALISGEPDMVANLANIVAALKQTFGFLWIGIYFVKEKELVLGPFQGPVACTRIGFGKGVCGTAWKEKRTLIVPDVDEFPGHIACSSESRSEIVLPALINGEVFLVMDIDSSHLNDFDQTDQLYLEELMHIIEKII